MTAGQFKVCTHCPYGDYHTDQFTVVATDKLSYQLLDDIVVGEYLRDGWTVTYHDHERG